MLWSSTYFPTQDTREFSGDTCRLILILWLIYSSLKCWTACQIYLRQHLLLLTYSGTNRFPTKTFFRNCSSMCFPGPTAMQNCVLWYAQVGQSNFSLSLSVDMILRLLQASSSKRMAGVQLGTADCCDLLCRIHQEKSTSLLPVYIQQIHTKAPLRPGGKAFFSVCVNMCSNSSDPRKHVKATKWPFPIPFKEKKKKKEKKSNISGRHNSHHSKRKENHASSDIFKVWNFQLLWNGKTSVRPRPVNEFQWVCVISRVRKLN